MNRIANRERQKQRILQALLKVGAEEHLTLGELLSMVHGTEERIMEIMRAVPVSNSPISSEVE